MSTHLETTHKKEWGEYLADKKETDGLKAAEEDSIDDQDETENLGVTICYRRTHKKRKSFSQQNLPDVWVPMLTLIQEPKPSIKEF